MWIQRPNVHTCAVIKATEIDVIIDSMDKLLEEFQYIRRELSKKRDILPVSRDEQSYLLIHQKWVGLSTLHHYIVDISFLEQWLQDESFLEKCYSIYPAILKYLPESKKDEENLLLIAEKIRKYYFDSLQAEEAESPIAYKTLVDNTIESMQLSEEMKKNMLEIIRIPPMTPQASIKRAIQKI